MSFLINGFMRLLSLVTPRAAEYLARPLAGIIWHLNARRREPTLINLSLCYPDRSDSSRREMARESMVHYVRNILEAGIVWHWSEQRLRSLFDESIGKSCLDEARAQGKGVILAAPHFGSWELCSLFLKDEFNGAVLFKPSRNQALNKTLYDRRTRTGVEMVPANHSGLKSVYKHLKAGRAVGILPDQDPSEGDGEFAPFMGVSTMTSVLIPRLVARTGCAVVFLACERRPGGRYRVRFQPADEAIYSLDTVTALSALNQGVESCIEIAPEQYLWAYKRFRNRPPGEPPIY